MRSQSGTKSSYPVAGHGWVQLIAVITFDQGGGTVTLRQASNVYVNRAALEPPQQPTTIDDVLPKDMNHKLRKREILRPFQTTFTWADQAIGRMHLVQNTIDTGDGSMIGSMVLESETEV